MTTYEDITPAEHRCGKMNCPSVFRSEDGKSYAIVGKQCGDMTMDNLVGEGEAMVIIDASLLEGAMKNLCQASVETSAAASSAPSSPLQWKAENAAKEEAEARETIMQWWDHWRKAIRDGDTGSRPRDWFESVLDHKDEVIGDVVADLLSSRARIDEQAAQIKAADALLRRLIAGREVKMDDGTTQMVEWDSGECEVIARKALEKLAESRS